MSVCLSFSLFGSPLIKGVQMSSTETDVGTGLLHITPPNFFLNLEFVAGIFVFEHFTKMSLLFWKFHTSSVLLIWLKWFKNGIFYCLPVKMLTRDDKWEHIHWQLHHSLQLTRTETEHLFSTCWFPFSRDFMVDLNLYEAVLQCVTCVAFQFKLV